MEENKNQKDKEKQNQSGMKKKIHSMFDSIPEEENRNVSSSLFRKTSFSSKKKDVFKILKEDESPKDTVPTSLKKSPKEILKNIPKTITEKVKAPSPVGVKEGGKSMRLLLRLWRLAMMIPFFAKKKQEPKGAIGLDIGTGLIKFAHMVNVGGKQVLINAKIKPIPNDVKSDPSKREDFVSQYIQDAFKAEIRKTPVYLGFNHPELAIELIKIPKVEDKDIPKTLFWKAQEQLSIQDMNTVYLDYLVVGEKEEFGERLIYVMAAISPKEIISRFVEGLFKIGLDIRAIEPNPLSLYVLLDKAGELGVNEVVLILDLGAQATSLNIVTNKELQFSRELPFSGDTITKAIADYCRVNFDEAQTLKEKWGSNEPGIDTQIGNAVQTHLESLASEIMRTFQYFSFTITKSTVKEMNKLILTGGMSHLKDLDKFLSEQLKIQVSIFNPLNTIEIDKNRLDIKALEGDSHKFSVAISLALREKN